jgi:hypothetical protein
MANWTIFILVALQGDTKEFVWSYLEELGYKKHRLSPRVEFHFLINAPDGCYTMNWSKAGVVKTKLVIDPYHLSDPSVISGWITDTLRATSKDVNDAKEAKALDRRYAFIYCGGGFGFYTENDTRRMLTIRDWQLILEAPRPRPILWDLVGFDCCLLSMLESLYQLRNTTRYVLACETYEPYKGFNSLEMVQAFEKHRSVKKIGREIIDSFILRVNATDGTAGEEDPADMTLVKLCTDSTGGAKVTRGTDDTKGAESNISKLVHELAYAMPSIALDLSINPTGTSVKGKTARIYDIDENQNGYHDLWSVIRDSDSRSVTHRSKKEIARLLNKIIVYYKSTNKLDRTNRLHTGISFCGIFDLDPMVAKSYFDLDAPRLWWRSVIHR